MNKTLIYVNRMDSRKQYHQQFLESISDTGVDFWLTSGANTCHEARYKALIKCINWGYDYIGWIDDDDILVGSIFSEMEEALELNKDCAMCYAHELQFEKDIPIIPELSGRTTITTKSGHHPKLFRTSILKNYISVLQNPICKAPERDLTIAMERDGHVFLELDKIGYLWRQWVGQDHRQ